MSTATPLRIAAAVQTLREAGVIAQWLSKAQYVDESAVQVVVELCPPVVTINHLFEPQRNTTLHDAEARRFMDNAQTVAERAGFLIGDGNKVVAYDYLRHRLYA
jgi:hypothetical protein